MLPDPGFADAVAIVLGEPETAAVSARDVTEAASLFGWLPDPARPYLAPAPSLPVEDWPGP